MRKKIKFGDILTVTEGVIIHGCNAQGVMGSGIAKQIKDKYPYVYQSYRDGKRYVDYQAIQKMFERVARDAASSGAEVHYPMIGAGLGGGEWAVISDNIESVFQTYCSVGHTLWIYESYVNTTFKNTVDLV